MEFGPRSALADAGFTGATAAASEAGGPEWEDVVEMEEDLMVAAAAVAAAFFPAAGAGVLGSKLI